MKLRILNLLIVFTGLLYMGCTKDQYRGHHLHKSKQEVLKDEHNNYHVKETTRVLNENATRNDKKEKKARKNLLATIKMQIKNSKHKKKKSLEFDYY